MKKALLLIFLSCSSLFSQVFNPDEYNWDHASYSNIQVEDNADQYEILRKKTFYYYYDDEGHLSLKYLFHRKVLVNSTSAIEDLKQIYMAEAKDSLITFQARVISPNGNVTNISPNNVQTGFHQKLGMEIIYFSFEGLEFGSQLEYFFLTQEYPFITGINERIQEQHPIIKYELDILSPKNLIMVGKTYALEYEFNSDSSLKNQNHIFLHLDSITAMHEEPISFPLAHCARAIFKVDENLLSQKKEIVSYDIIAHDIVNNLHRELNKKELETLQQIKNEIISYSQKHSGSTVRNIENYIKSNYHYKNTHNNEYDYININSIYSTKGYNETGGFILFSHILRSFDIKYNYIYTTNRSRLTFDPEFATHSFLGTMLIQIPSESDMLMNPINPRTRLGYVDCMYLHNYGLFIEEEYVNGEVIASAKTRFIKSKPAAFTVDSLNVKISFGDNFTENTLEVKRTLSGYSASLYQPYLELVKQPSFKKEIEESLINLVDEEGEVVNISIQNGTANLIGIKPLKVEGTVKSDNIAINAGGDCLLKIGSLIGEQSEMYSTEDERTMNIESPFAKTYVRTIAFEIPEGYQAGGLDALKVDEALIYENVISGRFTSDYTIKENLVTIKVLEFYDEVEYPKDLFEDYRRVINAAADFNKKTVLLKKI